MPKNKLYIGIDPGKSGAIVSLNEWAEVQSIIRLNLEYSEIAFNFKNMLQAGEVDHILLEKVHSMPSQGVVSTFKFGTSFGFLLGLLESHNLEYELISPQTWQKAMRCLTRGNKNITKTKAQKLFKDQKVIHATADALLLAELARQKKV